MGERRARLNIARQLLSRNMSLEEIHKVTDLPLSESEASPHYAQGLRAGLPPLGLGGTTLLSIRVMRQHWPSDQTLLGLFGSPGPAAT